MYSFNFPEMISESVSRIITDKEAVKSNLKLLFASERGTLFGDPYFGAALKRAIFEQTHSIIIDLMVDEIYTTIITFIPQIFVERKNITLYSTNTSLFAKVEYIYKPDNTSDLYNIKLMDYESA